MSKAILTNLDLNKNQILNAVIQPLATAPTNPVLGQYYYNSVDKKMYIWDGAAWVTNGVKYRLTIGTANNAGIPITLAGDDGANTVVTIPIASKNAAGVIDSHMYGSLIDLVDNGIRNIVTDAGGTIPTQGTVMLLGSNGVRTSADGDSIFIYGPTIDSSMSASSANAVQNKVVKAYVDNKIAGLPGEQFLDLTKTKYVDFFAWSSSAYPGSTDPGLDGKPVLVLALKSGSSTTYSFISLHDLVDTYTGASPISVSGGTISHANSGAAAGSYGNSANQTPAFGGAFNVPHITVDARGHVTGISNKTVKIPVSIASASAAGLMSTALFNKLNGLPTINIKTASIAAGKTSVDVSADSKTFISYVAYMAGEEVMLDVKDAGTVIQFSMAKAAGSQITIKALFI